MKHTFFTWDIRRHGLFTICNLNAWTLMNFFSSNSTTLCFALFWIRFVHIFSFIFSIVDNVLYRFYTTLNPSNSISTIELSFELDCHLKYRISVKIVTGRWLWNSRNFPKWSFIPFLIYGILGFEKRECRDWNTDQTETDIASLLNRWPLWHTESVFFVLFRSSSSGNSIDSKMCFVPRSDLNSKRSWKQRQIVVFLLTSEYFFVSLICWFEWNAKHAKNALRRPRAT